MGEYLEAVAAVDVELVGLIHLHPAYFHKFEHVLPVLELDEFDVHRSGDQIIIN